MHSKTVAYAASARRLPRRSMLAAVSSAVLLPALNALDALGAAASRRHRLAVVNRNPERRPLDPDVADDPGWWALVEFHKRLHELGLEDPRNLELRVFNPKSSESADIEETVRQVIAWKPDLIWSWTTMDTQIAKAATTAIPVVFINVTDPDATGIVASLARPGGNVTGVAANWRELMVKRLEMGRELLPAATTVAVTYDSRGAPGVRTLEAVRAAAPSLKLKLLEVDLAPIANGYAGAFQRLATAQFDAWLPIAATNLADSPREFAAFQRRARVPWLADQAEHAVRSGAVLGLGPDVAEQVRSAAEQAARILRGADPGTLPVIAQTRYRLAINRKAAREIGLAIPASLLLRADRVID